MTIAKNKVVSVNYHLTSKVQNDPEELVEQTSKEHPFVFIHGSGGLIPAFEKNLLNKKSGDTFDFHIDAANAYGIHEPDYVAEIPKQAFFVEGKFDEERVKIGEELPMLDAEGHEMYGLVVQVGEEHVTMDFNHPLAGHDLHFSGEILEVRDATPEELDHGHVHGPHGHHH
jgi:FKBP-type peptidyl-prolyl cis-trans isomerase SlyD